ncbi:MAG: amidohydrolase family protein, partial [Actinomycetes bacterium]
SSATAVPARILGLQDEVGSLRAGLRADVVVVDEAFTPALVLRAGERLA